MPKPIQIFIAYARKDGSLLDELRTHLTPLSRSGRVTVWYDGEITPGAAWEADIKKNLHASDIILLLVSASAIASDYFYEKEVSDALERHAQGTAHVVPLILRPCDWGATPLAELQAIPKNGKPATTWSDLDEAFADAVLSLRKLVEQIEQARQEEKEKAAHLKQEAEVSEKKKREAEAARQKDLPGMVLVKGGTFQMGEKGVAEPVHTVTLSDFYIGKYPVTQKQWKEIMGSNPSKFAGCDDCPVESVSWNDVQKFIQKLNKKTGQNYRLPTEAEWEYAARGGAQSKGYSYAGSNNLDKVGWHKENSSGNTQAVGQKQPNELGLYDMSGNVWEWCQDWYEEYSSEPQTNPTGPLKGDYRVLRGGSWYDDPQDCRVASRTCNDPTYRDFSVGFRLVLSPQSVG